MKLTSENPEFPYTPAEVLLLVQLFKVLKFDHHETLHSAYSSGVFLVDEPECVMCLSLVIWKIGMTQIGDMSAWCDYEKNVGQMVKDALSGEGIPVIIPGQKANSEN